jgi:outer membrane murein-binding lipoprotein Lpp
MALPVSFEQFAKDPLKAIMFLVVCAVGYLYVDNKMNLNAQIEKCDKNVQELNVKTDILEERLRKSDSTLARAGAKLEMLSEIKGL